jgi:MFS family permease
MTTVPDARSQLALTVAVFREVLADASIRRVVLASAGFSIGEWATWLTIVIYAYGVGGATAAGLVMFIALTPAALVAPAASTLGDRLPRERALQLAYSTQALVNVLTAAALLMGAAPVVVYVCAVANASAYTLTRPAHAAILPSLARRPELLTAANVATATVESVSVVVGPSLVAVVIGAGGPGTVFAVVSGVSVAALLLVLGLTPVAGDSWSRGDDRAPSGEAQAPEGFAVELAGGLRVLAARPGPRLVVGLLASAELLWGALDILVVVLAVDVLAMGESGAGTLASMVGVGGVVGSVTASALVGGRSLAVPAAAGLAGWGLAVSLIGLAPSIGLALAMLLTGGASRALMDTAARTLLQRVTPDAALSRVFGVVEGLYMAAYALSALLIPPLVHAAGPAGAVVVAGALMPLLAILTWRQLRATEATAQRHDREVAILRAIPMFAPLSAPVIERLGAVGIPLVAPAGEIVIREGDPGDRYYAIGAGSASVSIGSRFVRTLGPGEGFGEIALLRAVPRTATVRADSDLELLALERDDFLEAISGQATSRSIAESEVARHLGG